MTYESDAAANAVKHDNLEGLKWLIEEEGFSKDKLDCQFASNEIKNYLNKN